MSLDIQQQQHQQLQLDGLNHLMEAATALARLTNNNHSSTPSLAAWAAMQTSPFAAGIQVQQQQQQDRQGFLNATATTTTAANSSAALDRSTSVVSDEEDSSPKQPPQPQITNKNTHKKKKDNLKTTLKTTKKPSSSLQATPAAAAQQQQREIFPQRLLAILNDTSLSDIVSWLPHGRSFVIIRPDVFTEHVLPKYLPPVVDVSARSGGNGSSATKYPSFTRKLNRWGFRQATRGPDTGAFHHPLFRRDEPQLCLNMVCQRSRDRSTVASANTTNTNLLPSSASAGVKRRSKGTVKNVKAAARKQAPLAAAPAATTQPLQPRHAAAPPAMIVSRTSESSASSVAAAVAAAAATSFYQLAAAAAAASAPANQAASSAATTPADPLTTSTRLLQAITTDTALLQWSLQQRDEYERLRLAKALLYQSFLNAQQQQQNPPAFP